MQDDKSKQSKDVFSRKLEVENKTQSENEKYE